VGGQSTGRHGQDDKLVKTFNGALLSPSRIGDVNRSLVLRALCDHGALSRAELARMSGATRATIGNIVQDLIDAGLVEDLEPLTGTGRVGKPARPVWFAPRAGLCGAAALGVGTCEVALVNARGEVLATDEREFDPGARDSSAVAAAVIAGLRRVLPRSGDEVLGVGIAVPGVCDPSTGRIIGSGQLPGLRGTDLVDTVAAAVRPRVLVDNDARAQALGEKWFGDGRGVRSFASVQTGHGLGLGLVLDGVITRGRHGDTGELGHTCVVVDGERCRCGLTGCWETIATLRWLRREAGRLRVPGARTLTAGPLVAAAATSPKAAELLERYADNLAVGLANLVQVLHPERIILHGDAAAGGETLRALIVERIAARVLPYLAVDLDVVASGLDQRAGLLGAAGLVLSETFSLAA
jgi:predicted NBD/HSP70 family sugar kinase